jgi:hypothetical protein
MINETTSLPFAFFARWSLCLRGMREMPHSLGLKSKAEIWAVPTGLQGGVVWIEEKVGMRL